MLASQQLPFTPRLDESVTEKAHLRARRQRDRRLAPARRQAPADRGRRAHRHRLVRLRAQRRTEQHRRRVARQRVRERAGVFVIDAEGDRGVALASAVNEHAACERQCHARLEARLQVGAQRVARERRVRERFVPMPSDVSEHDRHLARPRHEEVVEVSTRRRALGGTVCDRDCEAAEPSGDLRHERRLHGTEVAQQADTLALELARAPRRHAGAHSAPQREDEEHEDDRPAPVGHLSRQRDVPADAFERVAGAVHRRVRAQLRGAKGPRGAGCGRCFRDGCGKSRER